MKNLTENNSKGILLFPRLFKPFYKEQQQRLTDFKNGISFENEVKEILQKWQYNDLIPASSKHRSWKSTKEIKQYLIRRKEKQIAANIEKQISRLNAIASAPDLGSGRISIKWKRSQMWGSNPTADVYLWNGESSENYSSGSIGGCGYDKESTAIAQALNQSNSVLKALYLKKEKKPKMTNRDLFGYGSGSGLFPNIEGGVGVSCYPAIFAKIGYVFKGTAHGKTFDQYEISKK